MRRLPLAIAIVALTVPTAAGAQDSAWAREKCARYARDWKEALLRYGRDGLSPAFVDSHEAFLIGGCAEQGHVCPQTTKDFELANALTIRAMNFGAASTFLPFGCRRK